jgi:hypothetical protein
MWPLVYDHQQPRGGRLRLASSRRRTKPVRTVASALTIIPAKARGLLGFSLLICLKVMQPVRQMSGLFI